MKTGNLIFSAAQFLFAVLIMLLGGLFIGLQRASHLRFSIAEFFAQSTFQFSFIGYAFLGCGLLLLTVYYAMHRGVYYKLCMGKKEVWIDPTVIRSHVKEYWQRIFPNDDVAVEVDLSKEQQIELFVEFPPIPEEKQLAALKQAENELGAILKKQFGYEKEFLLSVLIK
jgi:hypothetical protein